MAKVLIVEDSPAQAALIAELIDAAGHEAHKCTDPGAPVTQIVTMLEPAIVLLDLMLLAPDGRQHGDGFQICREIKRQAPHVAVVIVSAQNDPAAAEWASLQGADAFLHKPFAYEDLVATIAAMLARAPSTGGGPA